MTSRAAWWASILVACAAFASSREARAEPATSALSWVRLPGAETCITTPELGARIEERLGRSVLVSPSVADISIEGRVEPVGSGAARRYRVVVGGTRRTGETIGTREITSPGSDCRALDDGLVLVIALMIDPDALERANPPPPAPPPRAVTREIVNERVVVHEVERVPVGPPPWIVEGSLAGVAAIERVPGAAPGARVALRVGPSRLGAFEVSLGAVPSHDLDVGTRAVSYTMLEAGLAFCPGVALGRRAEIDGCAGARFGDLRSRGQGFTTEREVDRGFFDVAFGGRASLDLFGPVFGLLTATALVPVVRQDTTATNALGKEVVVDRRSALGAEVGAGIGVHFSP